MSKVTLEQSEITALKELEASLYDTTMQLGSVEMELVRATAEVNRLNEIKASLQSEAQKLFKKELELSNTLSGKYGYGEINIETGEYLQK